MHTCLKSLLVLFFFISCTPYPPNNVIEEKEMSEIIGLILLAKGAKRVLNGLEDIAVEASVLKNLNIDTAQFKTSLDYYHSKGKMFDIIDQIDLNDILSSKKEKITNDQNEKNIPQK